MAVTWSSLSYRPNPAQLNERFCELRCALSEPCEVTSCQPPLKSLPPDATNEEGQAKRNLHHNHPNGASHAYLDVLAEILVGAAFGVAWKVLLIMFKSADSPQDFHLPATLPEHCHLYKP